MFPWCFVVNFYISGCLFGTGLGQVQLKMGDLGSALSNMEKVLKVYPNNCGTLKVSELKLKDI